MSNPCSWVWPGSPNASLRNKGLSEKQTRVDLANLVIWSGSGRYAYISRALSMNGPLCSISVHAVLIVGCALQDIRLRWIYKMASSVCSGTICLRHSIAPPLNFILSTWYRPIAHTHTHTDQHRHGPRTTPIRPQRHESTAAMAENPRLGQASQHALHGLSGRGFSRFKKVSTSL